MGIVEILIVLLSIAVPVVTVALVIWALMTLARMKKDVDQLRQDVDRLQSTP
ncbi:hypothetical protein [Corynebacterium sp. 13CS0277]|uniref:hypothetical protein n=1 Tax=Corynebacterium sp. 13CS0277 TaxID=2071994 RepID=UPI001304C268|nr:hypothetical protein [Corynebacterium sp. 13CS0277]